MIFPLSQTQWDKHQPAQNPFLHYSFYQALMKSASASTETGWAPVAFENDDGLLISFKKAHSYGEYIFDWSWADAFQKHGLDYYPKLTSMTPFTPVTTQHFLMKEFNADKARTLLLAHDEHFMKHEYSSAHFLFLPPEEISVFESCGYMIRESMQYHFFNHDYENFEDFLSSLKSKKAKNIRHERAFTDVTIKQYTGNDLTPEHADRMYNFYISTILNKHSYDYLNKEFFQMIFQDMKENILYVEASQDNKIIAGSLFFYDNEKLYGRYWGSTSYVDNLHFELCYYQGIDFCLKHNLKVFEAGAQGEHKIARGFRPVKTYSAHKIKHPAFQKAIADFIESEKKQVSYSVLKLSEYLPFKS